ncbi:MAG TPA: YbhB/YbcL family Raf kinase inhibitor-like protein [Candidatus Acidoferrum sp.]|nr:YbhB/YbcL family Raf kinase inhibitor-like protein [Candidatus Acidoferrum sp.]
MKVRVLFFLSLLAVLHMLTFPGETGLSAAPPGALHAGRMTTTGATEDWSRPFRITSTTFKDNQIVPASMVFNGLLGSSCIGGNMSPELKWTKSWPWTRSYAVVAYDVTANFTHWGIYNIPPDVTELPENAGVATSSYDQITDDAGNVGYVGPCPPPGIVPNGVHTYLFTVYALDKKLDLPAFPPGFPAPAETLFRAMIGHVIETATITGLFSCNNAPAAGCS